MSRFNENYEYEQKLVKAKLLLTKNRLKEAEKLLIDCYEYFDNEHLIINKLDTVNHLIDIYLTLGDDSKIDSLFLGYESESKENGLEIPAGIFHSYGRYFSKKGDVDKSIENYHKAIEKYNMKNDLGHAAISYLNLGEQLRFAGQFDRATIAFIKSRDIFLKLNQRDLAITAFLALTEMVIKLRGRSIPIDLDTIEFVLKNTIFPKSPTLATTYINVGLIFQEVGNLQKAQFYLKKAIEISKEIRYDDTKFHAYLNLGYIFENLQKYSEAKEILENALIYFIKKEDNEHIALAYHGLGLICKDEGDLDNAIKYVNKSMKICRKVTNFELNLRIHELLADLYREKRDYENSFLTYKQILRIYKKSFEKTSLLGLKQIFREKFSRIISILKNLNELLKIERLSFQTEILEELEDNAVNICKTGSQEEILEEPEKDQLKEQVISLKKRISELTAFLNDMDREKLENTIIDDICKKIEFYQTEEIDPARIREFLIQIPDPILRHNFLVKILSRVPNYYYTKEYMYRKLKEIVENIPFDENDDLIFGVLSETWNKSQNLWSYISARSISRYVNTDVKKTPNLLKFLSKIQSNKKYYVIFLDDVIGSGKQFIKYYKKDFEMRLKKYPILNKENIRFYLITGIISNEALEYISKNSIFKEHLIKYHRIIKGRDKAFYEGIWDNKENLLDLKKYLYELDPYNWDGWKEDPDKETGMQYLVVLDWRTPNNTIGILWNIKAKIKPLFPR